MTNKLALLAIIGVTLACAVATPTAERRPPTAASGQPLGVGAQPAITSQPTSNTGQPSPVNSPPFTIALEYAIPGVAQAYAQTGVTYAKPQPIFGMWGLIEPQPGEYNWKPLDDLVIEYQSAGFTGIQLLITVESPWASMDFPALLHPGNTFPKEEYLDEYAAFVGLFVERYDGDGVADAPGVLYPIHHYGIEREFTGFWPGSAEDYVRLLQTAYPAIHAADDEAEVLLVAILIGDVFDGNPDAAEVQRRLATPLKSIRKSVPEIRLILQACEAYDIIDFHSLLDYSEILPTAAWLRAELAGFGCEDKPIWIGDSFSMSALVGFDGRPFYPNSLETNAALVAALEAVADPADPAHDMAAKWLYAEEASGLVKKIVVAASDGLRGINVGNLEDWKTRIPAVDVAAVPAMGTAMFMGMMETQLTGRKTGERLPNYSRAGDPRPPFFAIQLANAKINGFVSVENLTLADGVWAFRFERPAGPLWVLWYDDGVLHLPGEGYPSVAIELPFPATEALITRTPTSAQGSQTETLSIQGGVLHLTLDAIPLFIEEKR